MKNLLNLGNGYKISFYCLDVSLCVNFLEEIVIYILFFVKL